MTKKDMEERNVRVKTREQERVKLKRKIERIRANKRDNILLPFKRKTFKRC